jgi:hypothetical protein
MTTHEDRFEKRAKELKLYLVTHRRYPSRSSVSSESRSLCFWVTEQRWSYRKGKGNLPPHRVLALKGIDPDFFSVSKGRRGPKTPLSWQIFVNKNGASEKAAIENFTDHQSMQAPPTLTEDDDAPIPPETVSSNPNMTESNVADMNRTVIVRRKAAKHTLPFDLAAGELDLVPSTSQAEDIPATATKKRRLEDSISAPTDEAATNNASSDVSVGLPAAAAAEYVDADPLMDTQPNAEATRVTARWKTEEDARLTRAVANTSKKRWGKKYKTDWVAVAALVPGRTKLQCKNRWMSWIPALHDSRPNKIKWHKYSS